MFVNGFTTKFGDYFAKVLTVTFCEFSQYCVKTNDVYLRSVARKPAQKPDHNQLMISNTYKTFSVAGLQKSCHFAILAI